MCVSMPLDCIQCPVCVCVYVCVYAFRLYEQYRYDTAVRCVSIIFYLVYNILPYLCMNNTGTTQQTRSIRICVPLYLYYRNTSHTFVSLLQKHVTCRTNVYHTLCGCYPAVQTLSLLQKHVTRRTYCVPHSVQVLPSSQKSPRHPSPTSPTANVYIGICPPSLSPGEWPGICFFAGVFFGFFLGFSFGVSHLPPPPE